MIWVHPYVYVQKYTLYMLEKRNFTYMSWSTDPCMTNYAGSSMFQLLRMKTWLFMAWRAVGSFSLVVLWMKVAILNLEKKRNYIIIRVGKRGCGTVHMLLLASLTQLWMLIWRTHVIRTTSRTKHMSSLPFYVNWLKRKGAYLPPF
jgi:hypothetical protein